MVIGKLTNDDINLKYWYKQPKSWSKLSYEGKYRTPQPPTKEMIIDVYKNHKKYYKDLVH